jgi:hypothetical protein
VSYDVNEDNEMAKGSGDMLRNEVSIITEHTSENGADRLDIRYKLIASSWCSLRPIRASLQP